MAKKNYYILYSVLFLFLFPFVLLGINTQLIFHLQQLGFSLNRHLIHDYLNYPGGILEYFSIFLFQFASSKISGAFLYSLLILALTYLSHIIGSNKEKKSNFPAIIFPSIIASVLITEYNFPIFYLIEVLALFILFKLTVLTIEFVGKSLFSGLFLIFLILAIAYYLVGGIYFLTLVFSTIIYLFLNRPFRYLSSASTILLVGILIPFVLVQQQFFITLSDSYFRIKPYFSSYQTNWILYLFILGLPINILINKFADFIHIKEKMKFAVSIILLFFMILLDIQFIDHPQKKKLEIDFLAYNKEWQQVINKAKQYKLTDRITQFHTNRALFQLGKLPSEMFNYSQTWGIDGLILTRQFADNMLLPSTQWFIELAYINEAIHWGNEAISQNEYSPQIIEQLIISNLIANKPEQAKMYINALKEFPFYKSKAIVYDQMLINNQLKPEFLALRQLMPVNNFRVNRMAREYDLRNLLTDKPHNRMAYEYLMAYYLLNNNLASFYKFYELGKDFYNGDTPKIYEEALAMYAYELNEQGKEVPQLDLDEKLVKDFTDYVMILYEYNGNKKSAKPELTKKYWNTYWYYIHYNSPITNNKLPEDEK